jgi:transposase
MRVGKSIRGLRWCSECNAHLNRDRNAACNIRKVFQHRFAGAEQSLPFQSDPIDNAIMEFDSIEIM